MVTLTKNSIQALESFIQESINENFGNPENISYNNIGEKIYFNSGRDKYGYVTAKGTYYSYVHETRTNLGKNISKMLTSVSKKVKELIEAQIENKNE